MAYLRCRKMAELNLPANKRRRRWRTTSPERGQKLRQAATAELDFGNCVCCTLLLHSQFAIEHTAQLAKQLQAPIFASILLDTLHQAPQGPVQYRAAQLERL